MITKAEWDRVIRSSRVGWGYNPSRGATRKIDGKEFVLVALASTAREARSLAGDGRSEGVSIRVIKTQGNARSIYAWHNNSKDALDWIKTALEP